MHQAPSRLRTLLALASAVLAAVAAAAQSQEPVAIDDLLRVTASYIDTYEREFSAVLSDERYEQFTRNQSAAITAYRRLRSEFALINLDSGNWVGFRDVFEVDGRAVGDRAQRLSELFLKPKADLLAQAKRITDESARLNLGSLIRTLNTPTIGLAFIRRENQDRSVFKVDGEKQLDNRVLTVLRFDENVMPRMITSKDHAAARGVYWIEPKSGLVVQSELMLDSVGNTATITVRYGPQPGLDVWVPIAMDEQYGVASEDVSSNRLGPSRLMGYSARASTAGTGGTIEGHATYSNFRKFKVNVSSIIKGP